MADPTNPNNPPENPLKTFAWQLLEGQLPTERVPDARIEEIIEQLVNPSIQNTGQTLDDSLKAELVAMAQEYIVQRPLRILVRVKGHFKQEIVKDPSLDIAGYFNQMPRISSVEKSSLDNSAQGVKAILLDIRAELEREQPSNLSAILQSIDTYLAPPQTTQATRTERSPEERAEGYVKNAIAPAFEKAAENRENFSIEYIIDQSAEKFSDTLIQLINDKARVTTVTAGGDDMLIDDIEIEDDAHILSAIERDKKTHKLTGVWKDHHGNERAKIEESASSPIGIPTTIDFDALDRPKQRAILEALRDAKEKSAYMPPLFDAASNTYREKPVHIKAIPSSRVPGSYTIVLRYNFDTLYEEEVSDAHFGGDQGKIDAFHKILDHINSDPSVTELNVNTETAFDNWRKTQQELKDHFKREKVQAFIQTAIATRLAALSLGNQQQQQNQRQGQNQQQNQSRMADKIERRQFYKDIEKTLPDIRYEAVERNGNYFVRAEGTRDKIEELPDSLKFDPVERRDFFTVLNEELEKLRTGNPPAFHIVGRKVRVIDASGRRYETDLNLDPQDARAAFNGDTIPQGLDTAIEDQFGPAVQVLYNKILRARLEAIRDMEGGGGGGGAGMIERVDPLEAVEKLQYEIREVNGIRRIFRSIRIGTVGSGGFEQTDVPAELTIPPNVQHNPELMTRLEEYLDRNFPPTPAVSFSLVHERVQGQARPATTVEINGIVAPQGANTSVKARPAIENYTQQLAAAGAAGGATQQAMQERLNRALGDTYVNLSNGIIQKFIDSLADEAKLEGGAVDAPRLPSQPHVSYAVDQSGRIGRTTTFGSAPPSSDAAALKIPDSIAGNPRFRADLEAQLINAFANVEYSISGSGTACKLKVEGPNLPGTNLEEPIEIPPAILSRIRMGGFASGDELVLAPRMHRAVNAIADSVATEIIEKFKVQNSEELANEMESVALDRPTAMQFTVTPEEITRNIGFTTPAQGTVLALDPRIMRNAGLSRNLQTRINAIIGAVNFVFDGEKIIAEHIPTELGQFEAAGLDAKFIQQIRLAPTNRSARFSDELLRKYIPLTDNIIGKIVEQFEKENERALNSEALPMPTIQYSVLPQGGQIMRAITPIGAPAVQPPTAMAQVPDAILKNPTRRTQLNTELGALFLGARAILKNGSTIEIAGIADIAPPVSGLPTSAKAILDIPPANRQPHEQVELDRLLTETVRDMFDDVVRKHVAQFETTTSPEETERRTPAEVLIENTVNARRAAEAAQLGFVGWLGNLPVVRQIKNFFQAERTGNSLDRQNNLRYRRWTAVISLGLLGAGIAASAGVFGAAVAGTAGAIWTAKRLFSGFVTGASIFEITGRMADRRLRTGNGALAALTADPSGYGRIKSMEPNEVVERMGAIEGDCRLRNGISVQQWLTRADIQNNPYDTQLKATYRELEKRFRDVVAEEFEGVREKLEARHDDPERLRILEGIVNRHLRDVTHHRSAIAGQRLTGTITRGIAAVLAGTFIGSGGLGEAAQRVVHGHVPMGARMTEAGPIGRSVQTIAHWLGMDRVYENQFRPFWHGENLRLGGALPPPGTPAIDPGTPAVGTPHVSNGPLPDKGMGYNVNEYRANLAAGSPPPPGTPAALTGAFAPHPPAGTPGIAAGGPGIGGGALGAHAAEQAGKAAAAAAGNAVETASHTAARAAGAAIEAASSDLSTHHLLIDSAGHGIHSGAGFTLHPDGTLTTGSIGHAELQRALRRTVMDSMNFGNGVFSLKNAGEVENAVANLYELLRHHHIKGFSAEELLGKISYNESTGVLKIEKYAELKNFINERLMDHAQKVVSDTSPALRYAAHTNKVVWEHLLEKSASNTGHLPLDPTWHEKALQFARTIGEAVTPGDAGPVTKQAAAAIADTAAGQGRGTSARDLLAKAAEGIAANATSAEHKDAGNVLKNATGLLKDAYGKIVDLGYIAGHRAEFIHDIAAAISGGNDVIAQQRILDLVNKNHITINPVFSTENAFSTETIKQAFTLGLVDDTLIQNNTREFLKGVLDHKSFTLQFEDGTDHLFKVSASSIAPNSVDRAA